MNASLTRRVEASVRRSRKWTALLTGVVSAIALAAPPSVETSDVLKAKRPSGGEYFGLYLMGKKVGYLFSELGPVPGSPDKVRSVNEFVFKATVGNRPSRRTQKETRIYEARPGGRLLAFTIDQEGDGGDQTLEGKATSQGAQVTRRRPGQPDEILSLPPILETVEDADPMRVALYRGRPVEGFALDGQDLETYKVSTHLARPEERYRGGVKLKLARVVTVSQKEKVPVDVYVLPSGEIAELSFGETMRALQEPKETAMRLDQVEVFALTRVVLPKAVPAAGRKVPGTVRWILQGLPEKFQRESFRQSFRRLENGAVEVTVVARAPSTEKLRPFPLEDPSGGENLKATLAVEAKHPEILAMAKEIVGEETDAYLAAKKVNAWVARNVEKDYGASADRAADVLRTRKGDCTEHSLLAVALLRAAKIPAKRIDGLVYMVNEDGVHALYWHEWVAAFVGEWTQLDPTFSQPVADAAHLALGEESNAEITPLIGQLKVLDVR